MSNGFPDVLVSTQWLAANIDAPDVRILDASWYLPTEARDTHAEYETSHIPGAQFFNIDEISDTASDLPHMVPSVEKFLSRVRKMGIGDGHRVVVYDSAGIFSAARVWWLFRVFGIENVAVLDGGMKKWLAEGGAVENTVPVVHGRHLKAAVNAALVKDVTQVAAASKLQKSQILDARSPERFRGEAPEPRAGLRSGHIPGSSNVCFEELLNSDGTMKSAAGLRQVFEAKGVDMDRPIITSCGSGVTAAIINLALERVGHRDHALYDGSWAEWGMDNGLQIEIG